MKLTVISPIVLAALRARNLAALAAVVLLAGMSLDALLRDRGKRGQLSLASWLVVGLWALSLAAAAAALALGLA